MGTAYILENRIAIPSSKMDTSLLGLMGIDVIKGKV